MILGRKTSQSKKQTKSINKSENWKSLILIAVLFAILLSLLIVIIVIILMLSREIPSSAELLTSSKSSNKFEAKSLIKIVKRDEWCKIKSIQGKNKLQMPVPKAIIMQTFTKECETKVNYNFKLIWKFFQ